MPIRRGISQPTKSVSEGGTKAGVGRDGVAKSGGVKAWVKIEGEE